MKLKAFFLCACLAVAPWTYGQDTSATVDLKQAALPEAHMVVYGKHNPERDYQNAYLAEVWQTVVDEKIGERLLAIVTSRVPEQNVNDVKQVLDELRAAIDPTLTSESLLCEEALYAQVMQFPTNHHLALLKFQPGIAAKIEASCQNLLGIAVKKSEGKIPITRVTQGDVEVTSVQFPQEVPFQPAFARLGDVFVITSWQPLLLQAVDRLQNGAGASKFDEQRFVEALEQLPEPEDAVVIFDGERLFKQLREMGTFIRQQSHNDPKAEKAVQIMDLVIDELAVIDYEVTVEYTEDHQNRSVALGKLTPDASERLLGKMALGGEAFDDWQSWIPADAVAYCLSKGVRLHPAYERVMEILTTKFAEETKEPLAKFAKAQEEMDFHLDRDIFQSFSGETVSITLPGANEGQDSFVAVKCTNPDRIRELLHRLVENLNKIPALQAQQVQLTEVDGLEGFETLSIATLAAFNVKPVIGFRDGWMMFGSNPACVQKVLDARAGKIPTIDSSANFARFDLQVEGPVDALAFTDVEKSVHHAADMIRKVGGVAPMILAMAGAKANAEELKPAYEAIAILPSVAKVIEKFDYYQANLSVVQAGPLPDSYLKQNVLLIRPPVEETK